MSNLLYNGAPYQTVYRNITVRQGETLRQELPLSLSIDLTNFLALCQMRLSVITSDKINITANIVVDSNNDASIFLEASATETKDYTINRYLYNVEITDGTEVYRVYEGIIEVLGEIVK